MGLLLPLAVLGLVDAPESTDSAISWDWLSLLSTEAERLQNEQKALDEKLRQARQRLEKKSELGRRLLEGRLNLSEAAMAFKSLEEENPVALGALRQRFPEARGLELYARAAIESALNQVPDTTTHAPRLTKLLDDWTSPTRHVDR
jgi:hypothetical protein